MQNKSVWDDISKYWKRVAAVIAAVGVLSTFIINVFNAPTDKVLIITAGTGIILLLISFYVDKQTQYIREEIQMHKKDTENKLTEHTQESKKVIDDINDSLKELKDLSKDTRKDTLRIQLLMVIRDNPDNIDTILKLAETYFVKLKGDWYMTNEFTKWAKAHDVVVPREIFTAISANKEN